LNDELYEVHQIMTRNVQEVLGVGEKLDRKFGDLFCLRLLHLFFACETGRYLYQLSCVDNIRFIIKEFSFQ